jgi:3-hydroxyacyl-CoA dehydrogenase
MKRIITKVAVLGSGIMGSRTACQFAGTGVEVLLLDMLSKDAGDNPNRLVRNKMVNDPLQTGLKSNPSPVYTADVAKKITTGNFTENMKDIASADRLIEFVVERLDIKLQIFAQAEQYRKPGTLIISNTSGIPFHLMAEGRSDDFKQHFCGTHFFNPPRYLKLLEIIPTPFIRKVVVDFLIQYGDLHLGKTTVLCKDPPAFIANRIGVYSIMSIFHNMQQQGLSIDEIDALTGPIIGRPKSATFRTADVVGIYTLVKVAKGVAENCPNDEANAIFKIPDWLEKMVQENKLGDKTGEGFFKKIKSASGKDIQVINFQTGGYEARQKPKIASMDAAKPIEDLIERIKLLQNAADKAGNFYKSFHYALFSYISFRIPDISDELYRIDDAMKAGFGWEIGAFETWDLLGVAKTLHGMKQAGYRVADWVEEMLAAGKTSFYCLEKGKKKYYDIPSKTYRFLPGEDSFIVLSNFTEGLIWKINGCRLYDIGNDVAALEWSSKMNSIGSEVLEGIQNGISVSEEKFKGLVIANPGAYFSTGANVGMIFMLAIEQEYDELDMAIRMFQNTMMRVRYSAVPVVSAPHGLSLGGGCELNLHADKVCAAAEAYIGLVELGVGLIPGGGGTKEFVLRAADELHKDEPEPNALKERFLTIATAKVATSAFEAYQLGFLRKDRDSVILNPDRRIAAAKKSVIDLFDAGYNMPVQRKDITVLGRSALGALLVGINSMKRAGYATEHDALVATKLAYVMCGGDLSAPTQVSEQYLSDFEREAFLSLRGEKKTVERIQSVLKTGKPVRN